MKLGIKSINRNSFINWMLFLISVVISLVLGELIMRQVFPSFDPRGNIVFQKNDEGVILAPPNFSGRQWRNTGEFNVKVDINEDGFRDKKDLKYSKHGDLFLIGDSFVFGHGVEEEERFGDVLQQLFYDSLKIYNTAVSASHFLDYQKRLEYAKEKGAKVENILVGVCLENDIQDYDKFLKYQEVDSNNEFSIKDWLNRKSCLYNFLASTLQSNQGIRSFLMKFGLVTDTLANDRLKVPSVKELKSSAEQLQNLMRDYKGLAILIPSRMNWVEDKNMYAQETHEKFRMLLDTLQIPYLDIKPIFDSYCDDPAKKLHLEIDGHWNKLGHEVVAKAIFEVLKNKNPPKFLKLWRINERTNF